MSDFFGHIASKTRIIRKYGKRNIQRFSMRAIYATDLEFESVQLAEHCRSDAAQDIQAVPGEVSFLSVTLGSG